MPRGRVKSDEFENKHEKITSEQLASGLEELRSIVSALASTVMLKSDFEKFSSDFDKFNKEFDKRLEDKLMPFINRMQKVEDEMEKMQKGAEKGQQKMEEFEQSIRMNDVIITGIKLKPRNSAHTVTRGVESTDFESVEQQVISQLRNLEINIEPDQIETCHPLPSGGRRPPAVLIKFYNRKFKIALLKQGFKLKGKDIYINENLTKKNADIAKRARQLKKNGLIENTWTNNCRIYIKTKGLYPEQMKTMMIKNVEELENLNH